MPTSNNLIRPPHPTDRLRPYPTYLPSMFDQLKAMSAIAGLMKNKDAIAGAAARVQDELARRTITVESPDKSISVQVSGKLEVQTISLNPKVVQDAAAGGPAVHSQLEQLVQRAVNIALSKAKDAIAEEISKEAEKLGLGNIAGDLKKLGQ
jgi:DNA-binding protein YbaB